MADSDDPLDSYDRYARWIQSSFPCGGTSPAAGLLHLLERATHAFINDERYVNDIRYLRIWLRYIWLMPSSNSAAPTQSSLADADAANRETFVFLARKGIGAQLALYYEEFAAWLEARQRWTQAAEVYNLGIQKGAKPAERLARKHASFESRRQDASAADPSQDPSSPILAPLRPALAEKAEPLSLGLTPEEPGQPQQQPHRSVVKGKQKFQVFADGANDPGVAGADRPLGWQNISSLAERKKENTVAPRPWAGEKLIIGKTNTGSGKMAVFKDEVS